MFTRMIGITAGVTLTLFFAVTVLPTSAQSAIDRHVAAALAGLQTLHTLCWLPVVERECLADALACPQSAVFDSAGRVRSPDDAIVQVR